MFRWRMLGATPTIVVHTVSAAGGFAVSLIRRPIGSSFGLVKDRWFTLAAASALALGSDGPRTGHPATASWQERLERRPMH